MKVLPKRMLMIFTLPPYPLRAHGVSIRYFPIIEHLSKDHEIDLIVVDGGVDQSEYLSALRKYCRMVAVIPDTKYSSHGIITKLATYLAFLLPWTPPLSFVAHRGAAITRGIQEQTRNRRYDVLVWVGSYLVPNLLSAMPSIPVDKVFVDFIDSPTLILDRQKERLFRSDLLERYERWKTQRWEARTIRTVAGTIYVSEVDARTVSPVSTSGKPRHVIPNGIHTDSYTPARKADIPSPCVGFLGNMGYPPNVEAAIWLYEEVFVPLKKARKDLSLVIIGRNPVSSIQNLGKNPGVVITGTVRDIWSYVNAVDIFAFPLWTGAGLKNKILEAMHAGRPVITTPIGLEGIDAVPGRDLLICQTPEEFKREIQNFLHSPAAMDRMGRSGHSFVAETFSWPRILGTYEALLLGETDLSGRKFAAGKGA